MLKDVNKEYEQASIKTKQRPNQGIIETLTSLRERSLRYIDEYAYQNFDRILPLNGNQPTLAKFRIQDNDIPHIFEALKTATIITHLDLRYNRITDEGAGFIADYLTNDQYVLVLNLQGNDIHRKGAQNLSNALKVNTTLISLSLADNSIGKGGGMAFAETLQINITLEHLNLANCDLEMDSLIALLTILRYNPSLKSIDLSRPIPQYQHSNWMDDIAIHIAHMLEKNNVLQELHVQKFEIRDPGFMWICEKMQHNQTLLFLDLSCNRITRDSAVYLASMLEKCGLLRLNLAFNRLENEGAGHLATALLQSNSKLRSLDIRSNNIKGDGLCSIADAVKFNSALTELFIWGNVFEERACLAIENLLTIHRFEPEHVDVTPYRVDARTYLAESPNTLDKYAYWKQVEPFLRIQPAVDRISLTERT
ncbi:unnamed protein product [Rotaria sordida]|uniref:Uncharacterized protein n=4 Tax=Rotaria sordida TaxID=392033 RepID=A0A814KLW3_9BILA|nr:unnamed protein product [Rotaria sordida]CAF1051368.1 unnamed protein product [Rotaria sordida]CAF1439338.1 unnamed protein product [Rotaria sordida]CAF3640662.1 unnamed protein product [Rotaria sordida]CAF3657600.1 unnamed protein product [Rotaria sordida]